MGNFSGVTTTGLEPATGLFLQSFNPDLSSVSYAAGASLRTHKDKTMRRCSWHWED